MAVKLYENIKIKDVEECPNQVVIYNNAIDIHGMLPKQDDLYKDGKPNKDYWYKDNKRRAVTGNNTYVSKLAFAYDTEFTGVNKYETKGKNKGKIKSADSHIYSIQIYVNGYTIICRKWSEFEIIHNAISNALDLGEHGIDDNKFSTEARFWVANASCEFQFLRSHLNITHVFAKSKRQPVTFTADNGIFFQDALAITNSSLAKIPDLYNLPTRKMVGDLDYSVTRNILTPLSNEEIGYCVNDVRILAEFNEWIMVNYVDNGLDVPLTCTGLLRDSVKKRAREWFKSSPKSKYMSKAKIKQIMDLMPQTYEEFLEVQAYLFRGGYTHANIINTGMVIKEVNGVDFTSSYPAVMLQERYPMTPFEDCSFENVDAELDYIMDMSKMGWSTYGKYTFYGLRCKTGHSIESVSKTMEYFECGEKVSEVVDKYHYIIDNGRILFGTQVTVFLTDRDIANYRDFYDWDAVEIHSLKKSKYGRLPSYLTDVIIEYYVKKADLKAKGLDDTTEYRIAKAMVNSAYGMLCEKLHMTKFGFVDGEWYSENPTSDSIQEAYLDEIIGAGEDRDKVYMGLKMPRRILSVYWGVWTTAHARRRLLQNLKTISGPNYNAEDDTIYCDTDSIYFKNPEKYQGMIDMWNNQIYKINEKWVANENKNRAVKRDKGIAVEDINYDYFKTLGDFDWISKHGNYTRFKTLGAKRYVKETSDGKITQTIAGLPKGVLSEYASSVDADPFDIFTDGLEIPAEYCRKNAHSYNDNPVTNTLTDEFGNVVQQTEMTSLGIFPIGFSMKLTSAYAELIQLNMERVMPWDYIHNRVIRH